MLSQLGGQHEARGRKHYVVNRQMLKVVGQEAFLHCGCHSITADETYAWSGSHAQAVAMRNATTVKEALVIKARATVSREEFAG